MLHFRTRTRKIFRDMLARRGRSLLVILSIMIGVFGVTTMLSITGIITTEIDKDVRPDFISHTHVYVITGEDTISADQNQDYLAQIRQLPGVEDAEGQAIYPVSWQMPAADSFSSGFLFAFTEPFGEANLEAPSYLSAGRYPGAGEIAVEQRFADRYDLQPGDTLQFARTGDREWEITGLVIHPYFAFTPAARDQIIQSNDSIYANYDDAQEIIGFAGLSGIHVLYDDRATSEAELNTLVATIGQGTPYIPMFTTHDDPEDNFVANTISSVMGAMDILGILAMIISGFLVTSVMNTMILEQQQQIGIMKSQGASFADIVFIYSGMALVYGILGTIPGLLLSIPIVISASSAFSIWVHLDGLTLSPTALLIGAVMGIIVPVLAAIFPIWRATRITILDAITDRGITSRWGLSPVSRLIGRLPLPVAASQALSNLWQKKGRLTLTGITLMAAVAAFMGSLASVFSMDELINSSNELYRYEIIISPQTPQDYTELSALLTDNLDSVEAVYPGFEAAAEPVGFISEGPLTEGSSQIMLTGIDPAHSAFNFNLREGTGWQDDPDRRGIIISRPIADIMETGVDEEITLVINGQPLDYPVIGVDNYGFDAVYIDWQELAHTADYLDENNRPIVSTFYINLKGDPDIEAVDREISAIDELLTAHNIEATYHNQPEASVNQSEQAFLAGIMFTLMSIVMGAVGAVGLMTALSMAVFERQKEIGIMRSIGARSYMIVGQFMLEGVLIGIIAWLIAVPLSYGLGLSLLDVLPFDYMDLVYPAWLPASGLLSVIIVAALASFWPSIMAARKTVASVLRYQ